MAENDEKNHGRFPLGVLLPDDPPDWLRHLIECGLQESELAVWARIPKSEAAYEKASFDYAETCFESERDYDAGSEPDDPPFWESDSVLEGTHPDDDALLAVALALMRLARTASDAGDLVSQIMEWCEDEIDRLWDQMEKTEDAQEHHWCTVRYSCVQDYNEAFDAAAGRLEQPFSRLIQESRNVKL